MKGGGMLYYPVNAAVTEWPGDRGGGAWHYGTDFAANKGDPIYASFDGVVVFAGGDGAAGELYPGSGIWANGQGQTVDIQRADGLISRVGHMSHISVKVGQRVTGGVTVLGGAGDTGYSLGVHCHWELRYDRAWSGGAWRDPRKLGATPRPTTTPAKAPTNIFGGKAMIIYYANALGKKKPGWLVLGYTPKPLIFAKESSAKTWAEKNRLHIHTTNQGGFRTYLEAAGGTPAQRAQVA